MLCDCPDEGQTEQTQKSFFAIFQKCNWRGGFFSQEMRGEFATFKDKLSSVWIIMTKTLLVWPTTRLEWFLIPKKNWWVFCLSKKTIYFIIAVFPLWKISWFFYRRNLKKRLTYVVTQKTVRGLWIKIFWVLTYRTLI